MSEEQREEETSLPHRGQKSLTCHWFEEKLFFLDGVIRPYLASQSYFSCWSVLISHPTPSDSQQVGMPSHSVNAMSQGMTIKHYDYLNICCGGNEILSLLASRSWQAAFFSWVFFFYTQARANKSSILMISIYLRLKLEPIKNHKDEEILQLLNFSQYPPHMSYQV